MSPSAQIFTRYSAPISFADTEIDIRRIPRERPLPLGIAPPADGPLKILYFNLDTTHLDRPLATPTPLRQLIEDQQPNLLAFAETGGQRPPRIDEMTPYTLAPWLDDSTGAGMIVYVANTMLGKFLVRRSAPMCGIEVDIFGSRIAVFFMYVPPSRPAIIRGCLEQLTIRLRLRQAQGYHALVVGDLNALHPFHCPPERKRSSYNRHWHPWIRAQGLLPAPVGTFHTIPPPEVLAVLPDVLQSIDRAHPFTYHKGVTGGRICKSLLDWPIFAQGQSYDLACPTFDIHVSEYPGSHLPISLEIPIVQTTEDPRLHNSRIYRKWHPKRFQAAAKLWELILPIVLKTLRRIDEAEGTNEACRLRDAHAFFLWAVETTAVFARALEFKFRPTRARIKGQPISPKIAMLGQLLICLKVRDLGRPLTPEEMEKARAFLEGDREITAATTRRAAITTLEGQLAHFAVAFEDQILLQQHRRNIEVTRNLQDLQHRRQMSRFWKDLLPTQSGTFLIPNEDGTVDPSVIAQGSHMVNYWRTLFNRRFVMQRRDRRRLAEVNARRPKMQSDKPFTMRELHGAINRKRHSAAGINGLLPAFLIAISRGKPGGKPRRTLMPLLRLLNMFYKAEDLPEALKPRKLLIIPKGKGFPTKPSDGRGVGIECAEVGLMSSMLARRATNILEDKLEHCIGGARPRRGVGDLAAAAHTALIHTHKRGDIAILSATDQRKCFDSIPKEVTELFLKMYLGNGKLARMILNIITDTSVCVAWRNYLFPPFVATRGIPQGNACSPHVLNVLLDPLAKGLLALQPRWGVYIRGLRVLGLFYVDDICVILTSVKDTKDVHRLIEVFINRFGMAFNGDKHVILLVCRKSHPGQGLIIEELVEAFPDAKVQQETHCEWQRPKELLEKS